MDKKLLFLDCDPGTDDAAAILLALGDPNVELLGISAVGGNVPLEITLRNALDLVAFAGRSDIPVYSGATHPLTGEAITAEEYHGANGLGGIEIPRSPVAVETEPAWDAIHRLAAAHPGELTLVLTGPCTNAAIAFFKWNDLPGLLKEVVIMGGASAFGNHTAAAEFNFLADPEAAEAVLQSGANVTLCPLDVTHKAYITREELAALADLGSPQAKFTADTLGSTVDSCKRFGVPGAILHDPCAMLYALEPELFEKKHCWCAVETGGVHCRGRLITDAFADAQKDNNAHLVLEVDREVLIAKLMERMARYSA